MTEYKIAYELGRRLAIYKFASDKDQKVEEVTKALDAILEDKDIPVSTDVLDSAERQGSSSWGDKMELDTHQNTGINV